MARAWRGPAVELVTETSARHTAANAAAVAQVARKSGGRGGRARDLVVAQHAGDGARPRSASR